LIIQTQDDFLGDLRLGFEPTRPSNAGGGARRAPDLTARGDSGGSDKLPPLAAVDDDPFVGVDHRGCEDPDGTVLTPAAPAAVPPSSSDAGTRGLTPPNLGLGGARSTCAGAEFGR